MYSAKDGQLRISWYNLEPISLEANESLFILKLRLTTFADAADMNFDLNARSEIADRSAVMVDNVKLTMPRLVASANDYALSNNYPNPFNNITTIEYRLPETGKVVLSVFNLLGEQIAVLVNEEQSEGSYKVDFDGSALATGAYMYKIEVEGQSRNFVQTRMMVVNK
ncbi:MAG: T9SS type A sorting domain-containing protein, partial [Bacteroidales bacterium]|nr:T9SS type A sorting domain-containing protein [Bacteroidales bacterium]